MKAHVTDIALYNLWLEEKRMLSDSSKHVYCEAVERFLKENPDIDSIEDYNAFIIKHSIKKRCYNYYSALKAFIEYKIGDAAIRNRLMENLIRPPLRTDIVMERRYLTEDEIIDVINRLESPKHRIMSLIQSLTGVRAGDILRLRRDNIMPEVYKGRPTLRLNILGKGKKRNVIYIHDEIAQEVIMGYVANNYNHDEYYFIELGKMTNRKGTLDNEFRLMRMNYWWYWADLKQALQSIGADVKDFATHDFRRCFARRVWEKYKDIHILQGLLSHSNVATTIRYLDQSGLKNIDYHFEMQTNQKDDSA